MVNVPREDPFDCCKTTQRSAHKNVEEKCYTSIETRTKDVKRGKKNEYVFVIVWTHLSFSRRTNSHIHTHVWCGWDYCVNHEEKNKKIEREKIRYRVFPYTVVTDALFIRRKILGWYIRRREGAIINLRERHREWVFFSLSCVALFGRTTRSITVPRWMLRFYL